jgi:hypothetical protein
MEGLARFFIDDQPPAYCQDPFRFSPPQYQPSPSGKARPGPAASGWQRLARLIFGWFGLVGCVQGCEPRHFAGGLFVDGLHAIRWPLKPGLLEVLLRMLLGSTGEGADSHFEVLAREGLAPGIQPGSVAMLACRAW